MKIKKLVKLEFSELLSMIESSLNDSKYKGFTSNRTDYYYNNWSGTESMTEALHLAKFGDMENLKKCLQIKNEFESLLPNSIDKSWVYDTQGEFWDEGRILEGDPECMLRMSKNQNSRNVNLMVNIASSKNVDQDALINRAIVLTKLIDILESQGIQVSLNICCCTEEGKSVIINIKNKSNLLDLDRLIFCFHPSFLRRLLFRLDEMVCNAEEVKLFKINDGRGYPVELTEYEDYESIMDSSSYYIPRPKVGQYESIYDSIKELKSIIKEIIIM